MFTYPQCSECRSEAKRSDVPYGHASMLLLGEGSELTGPYNKYDKIRPHSIRSLQFGQKVRLLSFRPENSTYLQPPLPKPPAEKCIHCLLIRDTSQFYALQLRWRWFTGCIKSLDSGDWVQEHPQR